LSSVTSRELKITSRMEQLLQSFLHSTSAAEHHPSAVLEALQLHLEVSVLEYIAAKNPSSVTASLFSSLLAIEDAAALTERLYLCILIMTGSPKIFNEIIPVAMATFTPAFLQSELSKKTLPLEQLVQAVSWMCCHRIADFKQHSLQLITYLTHMITGTGTGTDASLQVSSDIRLIQC
jgi:hypothetical protein